MMNVTDPISQVRSVSFDEAANLLGVSRRTVQRRLRDGTLAGHRHSGRWFVDMPSNMAGEPTVEKRRCDS